MRGFAVRVVERRGIASRKQVYALLLPSALALVGALVYSIGTEDAFAFASAAASAVGIGAFADLLFARSGINCGKMFATGLLLAYGLTSFNTWYTVHPGLAGFIGIEQGPLCVAMAAVAFASALLFVVGETMLPELVLDIPTAATSPQAAWFVVTAFCIVVAAFVSGSLGYMGIQGERSGTAVSVLGWIGGWLVPPLFGMTLAVAIYERGRLLRILFYTLLCAEGLFALPLGRRVFIYTLFVGGIVLRFSPAARTRRPVRRALLVGAAIGVMYVASIGFLYIRFAIYNRTDVDPFAQVSLAEAVRGAYELSQVESYSKVSDALKENALRRGFILDFVAEMLDGTSKYGTAGGQDLINGVVGEIPSAFWKGKAGQQPAGEEEIAGKIFYTTFPDSALTTVTGGALDFGMLGALLYPVGAAVLMTAFLRIIERMAIPIIGTVVTLGGLYTMLNTQSGAFETIAFIRNSLLFAFLLYAVAWLRPTRSRSPGLGVG